MEEIKLNYDENYNRLFYVFIEKDKFKNEIYNFVIYTDKRIKNTRIYINKNIKNKSLTLTYPGRQKIIIENVSRRLLENKTPYIVITHISKNYNKTPQSIKGVLLD